MRFFSTIASRSLPILSSGYLILIATTLPTTSSPAATSPTAISSTPFQFSPTPPTPTPFPGPTPLHNTFIDQAYQSTYEILSGQVEKFDQYFGDANTLDMENTRSPWVRVRAGIKIAEYEGVKFRNNFASSIPLPIMEHKLHAFFDNDPDDSISEIDNRLIQTGNQEHNNYSVGLHYYVIDRSRFKINCSTGVRLKWPPEPYVKPRAMYSFPCKPFYGRATQYVYYYLGEGAGEKTNLEMNLPLGKRWLVQSETSATYDYNSQGVDLSQFMALMYLDKSAVHGESYAISLEGEVDVHTWPSFKDDEYLIMLRFYHKLWRDWLRIGVAGGLRWQRETDSENIEPDYWQNCAPVGSIYLEILFDSQEDLAQARANRYQ